MAMKALNGALFMSPVMRPEGSVNQLSYSSFKPVNFPIRVKMLVCLDMCFHSRQDLRFVHTVSFPVDFMGVPLVNPTGAYSDALRPGVYASRMHRLDPDVQRLAELSDFISCSAYVRSGGNRSNSL